LKLLATTRSMLVKLISPVPPPLIVPVAKSTTMALVARSRNSIESVPVPPSMESMPPFAPARKRSLPPRPLIVSLPLVPESVSLPDVPLMVATKPPTKSRRSLLSVFSCRR
jgi:hypothetical protein